MPDMDCLLCLGAGRALASLGLPFHSKTGPFNTITDVPGVSVGYATLTRDEGHAVRAGVTAILLRPAAHALAPVWAGAFSFNGNGEMTGIHWIEEAGCFAGPILITNTLSLGVCHHAAVRWLISRFPLALANDFWPLPVVAETYDGYLNDIAGLHVTEADAIAAIESAQIGRSRKAMSVAAPV